MNRIFNWDNIVSYITPEAIAGYWAIIVKDVSKLPEKGIIRYAQSGNPLVVSLLIFLACAPFSLIVIVI